MIDALRTLHLPLNSRKTPEIGRRVCLQTHSRMVIAASIGEEGNGFRIETDGIDCQSGEIVARSIKDAPNRTRVIHSLSQSLAELRGKLGEPASSITRFNKPLDEAISASPEAIQLLSEGYVRTLNFDFRGTVPYFQRAIALDSNLAVAYAALGSAEDNAGIDRQR